MIVRTNFTGRRFLCLGLKEDEDIVEYWSEYFTLGKVYNECECDAEGRNHCDTLDDVIILFSDKKETVYADSTMFQETKPLSKVILKIWICLN